MKKIYFIRYDFWGGDFKRVLKGGVILSFVTVFTVITLTKMSLEYSRSFFNYIFLLFSIFIVPFF